MSNTKVNRDMKLILIMARAVIWAELLWFGCVRASPLALEGPTGAGASYSRISSWFQQPKGIDMMADETDKSRSISAMEALKEVIKHFNDLKDPNGSKDAPARSCRDLANSHPDFKDDYYYIDPNKGNVKDTILVYCKMETGETCITPSPSEYHMKDLTRDKKAGESYLWLSHQLTKYKQFPYKSDGYQIKAIQSISSYATQNVTFHCMNTIAYHDQMINSKYKAVKLMSYNEENLTAEGKRAFRYAVNVDGCKTKSDKWDTTVIEMSTTNSKLLPILDVGVYDVGSGKQDFRIELGEVCFS